MASIVERGRVAGEQGGVCCGDADRRQRRQEESSPHRTNQGDPGRGRETDSSVFSRVGKDLARLAQWKVSRPGDVKADVWIADGRKKNAVPYPLLGQDCGGRTQLLNYSRGSACLTLKSSMVRTLLAHHAATGAGSAEGNAGNADSASGAGSAGSAFPAYLPETFIVYPAAGEADLERRRRELRVDERAAFLLAAAAHADGGGVWIAKGSAGMGGNGIEIGRDAKTLLQGIDACGKDTAWVVCRYIDRPFLLAGRKFDIRAWALLAPNYTSYLFEEGVARTSSFEYDLSDLSDRKKHLTNHCIQCEAPEYSKFEAGNELSFQQVHEYLQTQNPPADFHLHVLPQIKHIIREALKAGKAKLEPLPDSVLQPFQVFGFDFLLDQDLKVWLLEINGSPASRELLLPDMSLGIITTAILPSFASDPRAPPQGEWAAGIEAIRQERGGVVGPGGAPVNFVPL
ncbi:tubulin-tyrosine ligase family-domain-containing protein [Baffinella frigidus]|nr:tubulin-tyrosine ligase family-domain-containing protein [Cryptophyta sp. CCMP2293]